jgi:hypothetical protein
MPARDQKKREKRNRNRKRETKSKSDIVQRKGGEGWGVFRETHEARDQAKCRNINTHKKWREIEIKSRKRHDIFPC